MSREARLQLAAQASLFLLALWLCAPSLAELLGVTLGRLDEPYALWWLEPLFYRAALAAHQGLPLYGPPDLLYTPPIYNPGVTLVGSALFAVFGASLPVLRTFCFGSFCALALALGHFTARETRSPAIGLVACAWTLSCAFSVGIPPTVINVDSPSLLFCVLACSVVASARELTRGRVIVSAACVVIAFLFKQPAGLIAAPIALHLFVRDHELAFWFAAITAGATALVVGALLLASHGWYWTYALEIPLRTGHVAKAKLLTKLLVQHRLEGLALLAVPALLTGFGPRHTRALWLPLALALVTMAYTGITKAGGGPNTLLPAYLAGALFFLLLPLLVHAARGTPHGRVLELVSCALVVVVGARVASAQLHGFRVREERLEAKAVPGKPRSHAVPALAAFDARLQKKIRTLPGPVFVGGRVFGASALNTHQTGLYEGSVRTRVFDMNAVLEPALSSHRYKAMIVWEYPENSVFTDVLSRYYRKSTGLGQDPLIGSHVAVWLPR